MSSDGDDDDASSSGSQDEHWDRLEEQAMSALDARLNALGADAASPTPETPVPGADPLAVQSASSSSALPPTAEESTVMVEERTVLVDRSQLLREICKKDPYNPEDHVLTAEEMWGGMSDDEEEGTAEIEAPPLGAAGPPALEAQLAAQGVTVERSIGLVGAREVAQPAVAESRSLDHEQTGMPARGSPSASAAQSSSACLQGNPPRTADVSALLQQACQREPYRPEDHLLTAEEMWGDSASEGSAGQQPVPAQADGGPLLQDQPFTAEEMWGGLPGEEDGGHSPEAALPTCPAEVPRSSCGPQDRLARILAGQDAPQRLGTLGFEELEAVANDCQRAVETLRWVIARQRAMVASSRRPGAGAGPAPQGSCSTT